MHIIRVEPAVKDRKIIRACAYARVSTMDMKQGDSLENQVSTYTRKIKANPKFAFAGVYVDQGISGRNPNRPGFKRMLAAAGRKEFDLVMTKSISRFARDTVTAIRAVRELKDLGIGVYFEEQNINTLSGDGEVMLTVLASFAQEELRSMSRNSKWTIRNRFAKGMFCNNTSRLLGYDTNEYGELVINDKEAKTVRLIFDFYLHGLGSFKIAAELNEMGLTTVTGRCWKENAVLGVLKNEKYKGDMLLQKTFVEEGVDGKQRRNMGEIPQYYIEDDHEGIVSKEVWDKAQQIMRGRSETRHLEANSDRQKHANHYELTGKLFCPYCKKSLYRRALSGRPLKWLCSTFIKHGKTACKGININDADISKECITGPTIIEEVKKDGKTYYCYTRKNEYDTGTKNFEDPEIKGSSLLPRVHRPRRTAIKL
jgi:site-specific DNA recombinase